MDVEKKKRKINNKILVQTAKLKIQIKSFRLTFDLLRRTVEWVKGFCSVLLCVAVRVDLILYISIER